MIKHLSIKKFISLLMCCLLCFTFMAVTPSVEARTESDIKNDINELEEQAKALKSEIASLKNKKAEQDKIRQKIESQISNTQKQISLCNQQIAALNKEIAENEAKIKEKEKEKEDTIFLFKQRLRTISMSNGNSSLQILLGAENFSQFLSLAQLTKVVSAHDQKTIERINGIMDEISVMQEEINEKIAAQNEVKSTLNAKKAELDSQVADVNSVISGLNSSTNKLQGEVKKTEAEIAAMEAELDKYANVTTSAVYDGSAFSWPVPGHYGITSYYGKRWGTWHRGVDISDGGIYNAPIIAPADGIVVKANNSCTHNYSKNKSCGCGSGWGNYVMVDHGSFEGNNYKTLSGHMTKAVVATGQAVKKGQVIGYVGTTGYSTGYHCHFEVYLNGNRVDPMQYFKKVK